LGIAEEPGEFDFFHNGVAIDGGGYAALRAELRPASLIQLH
jgi:hypothetical protein